MAQECLRLSWRFTGIIDFKGKSYLFGLNYYLNWAETPIHHDAAPLPWPISPTVPTAPSRHCHSGTLRECSKWEPLSSYLRVEGETIAWESRLKRDRDMPFDWAPGARTAKDPQTGMYIMPVAVRAHVHVAGVDFGRKGPKTFKVSVAGAAPGRMIEVRSAHNRRHIDRDCRGAHNRAASTCRTVTVPSASVTAMQDVYLVLSAHGHQSASTTGSSNRPVCHLPNAGLERVRMSISTVAAWFAILPSSCTYTMRLPQPSSSDVRRLQHICAVDTSAV
jgi:hypothetical protein